MAERPIVPPNPLDTKYPVIDTDPHFFRVVRYARPSDYYVGAVTTAAGPALFWLMDRLHPSYTSRASYNSAMRLTGAIGVCAGFFMFYNRSSVRFFGWEENAREVEMDMREMVDRVKNKQPLYGESSVSLYQQGVAARNSRYSQAFMGVIPWFNFVNHNQHGVDTAKYFRAAEEELEREAREGKR